MSYTVSVEHNCRVVRGPVPVSEIGALLKLWSRGKRGDADVWVIDGRLSEALGVCMVVGSRRDTEAWRALLKI